MSYSDTNFIVDSGCFPFEIMVHFGSKEGLIKKLEQYITKYKLQTIAKMKFAAGYSEMFANGQTVLWLPKEPLTVEDLSVLQHEIFHCVHFILERVGIKCASSNKVDEVYAYLIQYITKQIYRKINLSFSCNT